MPIIIYILGLAPCIILSINKVIKGQKTKPTVSVESFEPKLTRVVHKDTTIEAKIRAKVLPPSSITRRHVT